MRSRWTWIGLLVAMMVRVSWAGPKAPFKVLYSNDTTHIESCVSPYHAKGEDFTAEMLEASVDETVGVGIDVHMLQPGLGWVPWWKSTVYPDAYEWYTETFKSPVDGFGKYMLAGGDMVEVFVKRCREKGIVPFISYRLNDGHGKEYILKEPGTLPKWGGHAISKFYCEHPEYRIGDDIHSWKKRVHNWAIPEARNHKLALIKEIIENYDIDGLELDFQRLCSFFDVNATSSRQRSDIMAEFVANVRQSLDENSRDGQHKWLCVRISTHMDTYDPLGIDLKRFVEAGVDMVNLSGYYFTEQQTDLRDVVSVIPETPVYLEFTHTIMTGKTLVKNAYDNFTFRRSTPNQIYTAAHIAYSQGATGVSAFNFVYYREHGTPGRGPFAEPPFYVFNHIGDKEWIARQSQHYVLCKIWNDPPSQTRHMPRMFEQGQSHEFVMYMAPPTGGWVRDGKLRIESEKELGTSLWSATFNGVELRPTDDVSEPYPNPYRNLLGLDEQYRAFVLPCDIIRSGDNRIDVTLTEGSGEYDISFMDIALK